MGATYTSLQADNTALTALRQIAISIDGFEVYAEPHAARVAELADRIAAIYDFPTLDRLALIQAALVHDLGEATMNREYIKRPSALSTAERLDLTRHTLIGESEAGRIGASRSAQLIVRWHHEWWNGAGYPDALCQRQIPLPARILRVVDSFDALTRARPFRPAYTSEEACRMIAERAAIEFDPKVVQVFLTLDKSC